MSIGLKKQEREFNLKRTRTINLVKRTDKQQQQNTHTHDNSHIHTKYHRIYVNAHEK